MQNQPNSIMLVSMQPTTTNIHLDFLSCRDKSKLGTILMKQWRSNTTLMHLTTWEIQNIFSFLIKSLNFSEKDCLSRLKLRKEMLPILLNLHLAEKLNLLNSTNMCMALFSCNSQNLLILILGDGLCKQRKRATLNLLYLLFKL